jgi:octaprenyl-diphosphate synthase
MQGYESNTKNFEPAQCSIHCSMTPDASKTSTKTSNSQIMSTIQALVADDMLRIKTVFQETLHSPVPLINQIAEHILSAGGKRLRPIIVLLVAKSLGQTAACPELDELAGIIELIHTATLIHDDVVDESHQRRHQPTANALWGNAASVLAGDFLYSKAFQLLARRANIPVMSLLAKTTNLIAESEVQQLVNIGRTEITEDDYYAVIQGKTAELYAAASHCGAIIALGPHDSRCELAGEFGRALGMAFQMVDDLLDYDADSNETGKNLGDDLAEGKLTLPLIYSLHHGDPAQQACIRDAIESKGNSVSLTRVIQAMRDSGGLAYTRTQAQSYVQKAKAALVNFPKNAYTIALEQLCDFVLTRRG